MCISDYMTGSNACVLCQYWWFLGWCFGRNTKIPRSNDLRCEEACVPPACVSVYVASSQKNQRSFFTARQPQGRDEWKCFVVLPWCSHICQSQCQSQSSVFCLAAVAPEWGPGLVHWHCIISLLVTLTMVTWHYCFTWPLLFYHLSSLQYFLTHSHIINLRIYISKATIPVMIWPMPMHWQLMMPLSHVTRSGQLQLWQCSNNLARDAE